MTTDNWQPEKTNEASFGKFLSSLPSHASILRLFDRGEYYTVHGKDAEYVAQTVFKTNTVIKYFGSQAHGLPYVTLTPLMMESLVRDLLLNKQFTVEVYAQSGGRWVCEKKATPGNLTEFEELVFNASDVVVSPVIASVKLGTRDSAQVVGVVFINATDRVLGITEFHDNDLFSNFESMMIQLAVKECVIPDNLKSYDYDKLRLVLQRAGIVVSSPSGSFGDDSCISELQTLVKESELQALTTLADLNIGCIAMSWLISYVDLMNDSSAAGQFQIQTHCHSEFMRLDISAVNALHLLPSARDGSNKNMSLFGLLDKCSTSQGSRLLYQYLHQPLLDIERIVQRQNVVSLFFDSVETRQALMSTHLKNMPDLSKIAKRLVRGKGGLREVVHFYESVLKFPGLIECLTALDSSLVSDRYLSTLAGCAPELDKYKDLVEETIDMNAVNYHEYRIKANYHEDLGDLQSQIDGVLAKISKEGQRVADEIGLELNKKLKIDKNSQYGYFLRVSRIDSNALKGKGFTELCTQKSGIFFTNDRLRGYSNEYVDINQLYQEKQSGLVKDIMKIVSTYCPLMEQLNDIVAEIDVLCSFAHVASNSSIPYVKPEISPKGSGNVTLKESRHPCLEVQDNVSFIANDVKMVRDESEFLLITGPNMGGKSTFIRQIAAISLMAQIGSFVPCTEAQLPVFDCILARVGAGDSQMKGISTFMAEMQETANILKTATSDSLVIIDELGRGTSTYDGFGLAWSISEYLSTQVHCFGLFATHFHELTALSEMVSTVKNLHVSCMISSDGITLLYKVQEGSSDQSFGIHVAELAKFPPDVIQLAKKKVGELEEGDLVYEHDVDEVNRVMAQLASIQDESGLEKFLLTL